jgi:hypothetical protein
MHQMNSSLITLCRMRGLALIFALVLLPRADAAVKERGYTFDDPGATAGTQPAVIAGFNRRGVLDSAPSTTDYGSVDPPLNVNNSLVPLIGSGNATRIPFYASASDRPGAAPGNLGLSFDGLDDTLYNPTPPAASTTPYSFDPRDFGQFDVLSQAWIRPTSPSLGTRQIVWRIGNENGGVVITADGHWAMRVGNPSAEVPLEDVEITSNATVTLNAWTHVAVFRGGNTSLMYVNGSIAAVQNGFWGGDGPEVRLGADLLAAAPFFQGVIDNFNIGTASDGAFNPEVDLDFFTDQSTSFSGVLGDVDQDGAVNNDDYAIWSTNIGFNNAMGFGDPTTLLLGDVDNSGDIDLFDFRVIQQEALAAGTPLTFGTVPEPGSILLLLTAAFLLTGHRSRMSRGRIVAPLAVAALAASVLTSSASAAVVVGDDFYYDGPTKLLHVGGGFTGDQQYAGGQNGAAGRWTSLWGQVGDGIVTTPDYTPPIDPFNGQPEPVAPPNVALYDGFFGVQSELFRDFELDASVSPTQTLYFGGRFKADLAIGTDGGTIPQFYAPRLFLNRVAGDDRYYDINNIILPTQRDRTQDIALGIESFKNINTQTIESRFVARLGGGAEVKPGTVGAPVNDGNWHTLIGKLELNVSGGANERLTVWMDPTGVETGSNSVQIEADVFADLSALVGTFHSQGTRPLNATDDPALPIDPLDSQIENPQELGRSYINDMAIGTAWQDVANVTIPRLTLRINPTTGEGRLINQTSTAFDLDGYSIESAAGSLNATGWNSLDEQNVSSWLQNEATANQLVETNFLGASTIAAGGQLVIGGLFNTSGVTTQDVVGRYSTQDGLINLLDVEYSTAGLEGDFDNDGDVDGRDFLRWQRGQSPNPLSASDLAAWQTNYGASGLVAAVATVPEPHAVALLCCGIMGLVGLKRHK